MSNCVRIKAEALDLHRDYRSASENSRDRENERETNERADGL